MCEDAAVMDMVGLSRGLRLSFARRVICKLVLWVQFGIIQSAGFECRRDYQR